MRYLGRTYQRKNKECLYPGLNDIEASYKIDIALEYANDFLSSYFFMIPMSQKFDDSEEKATEFCEGKWVEMLSFV